MRTVDGYDIRLMHAFSEIKPQAHNLTVTLSNYSFLVTPTFHIVLLSQILYSCRALIGWD